MPLCLGLRSTYAVLYFRNATSPIRDMWLHKMTALEEHLTKGVGIGATPRCAGSNLRSLRVAYLVGGGSDILILLASIYGETMSRYLHTCPAEDGGAAKLTSSSSLEPCPARVETCPRAEPWMIVQAYREVHTDSVQKIASATGGSPVSAVPLANQLSAFPVHCAGKSASLLSLTNGSTSALRFRH